MTEYPKLFNYIIDNLGVYCCEQTMKEIVQIVHQNHSAMLIPDFEERMNHALMTAVSSIQKRNFEAKFYFSKEEAAKFLGITERHIDRLYKAGKLKLYGFSTGRKVLYKKQELLDIVEELPKKNLPITK